MAAKYGSLENVVILTLNGPCGGETVYPSAAELARYQRDPAAFVAAYWRCESVDEYDRWIEDSTQGMQCSARTKAGPRCRGGVSGSDRVSVEIWREYCPKHGGLTSHERRGRK